MVAVVVGGASPASFFTSQVTAPGGGGGGSGTYALIGINKALLTGTIPYSVTIGAGGQPGQDQSDGEDGQPTILTINSPGESATFFVDSGKGGHGAYFITNPDGTYSIVGGGGGNGGSGVTFSGPSDDYDMCFTRSFGGGGGIFNSPYGFQGGTSGIGYTSQGTTPSVPGGFNYNGNMGVDMYNALNYPTDIRAGYGGGYNGPRGGYSTTSGVGGTYLGGAGSGGCPGDNNPAGIPQRNGPHPGTGSGLGAGYANGNFLRANSSKPGSLGGGGGGGGIGQRGISRGSAASAGGSGMMKIYIMP